MTTHTRSHTHTHTHTSYLVDDDGTLGRRRGEDGPAALLGCCRWTGHVDVLGKVSRRLRPRRLGAAAHKVLAGARERRHVHRADLPVHRASQETREHAERSKEGIWQKT